MASLDGKAPKITSGAGPHEGRPQPCLVPRRSRLEATLDLWESSHGVFWVPREGTCDAGRGRAAPSPVLSQKSGLAPLPSWTSAPEPGSAGAASGAAGGTDRAPPLGTPGPRPVPAPALPPRPGSRRAGRWQGGGMRLLFLAVLRSHTGNAVTAERVR